MECRLGKKWTAHTLSGAMLTALAALALIGTGCGKNPTGPKDGTSSSSSFPFINGPDEAWTTCNSPIHNPLGHECFGFTFKSDSTLFYVYRDGNTWIADTSKQGTWIPLGKDSLAIIPVGFPPLTGTYAMNDNKTSITVTSNNGQDITFTKTHGVEGIPKDTPQTTTPTGGNLVLGNKQAWTYDDEYGDGVGYIFRSNNTFVDIGRYQSDTVWQNLGEGIYATNGGNITLIYQDSAGTPYNIESGTYTRTNNTLVLTLNAEGHEYTVTNNVVVDTSGDGNDSTISTGGNLVLGNKQAWTYDDEYGGSGGYIFQSNNTFVSIGRYQSDTVWQNFGDEGTYVTNGGNITLIYQNYGTYYIESGTYTRTRDTLVLALNGEGYEHTYVLRVTNNVVVDTSGGEPGGGGGTDSTGRDSTVSIGGNPVNGANEAWVNCEYEAGYGEYCNGYIFHINGQFQVIVKGGANWFEVYSFTYAIKGNYIIVDGDTVSFTVSGNTLRLDYGDGDIETLTRTSGITVQEGGGGTGEIDHRLVNNSNEAWVDNYSVGNRDGFILHANGTYTAVTDGIDNAHSMWSQDGSGTWYTTTGNTLTLIGTGFYANYTGNYYLLGDMFEWNDKMFTRIGGVNIPVGISMSPPDDNGNQLKKQKQASLSKKPSQSKQLSAPKKSSAQKQKKPARLGKFYSSK